EGGRSGWGWRTAAEIATTRPPAASMRALTAARRSVRRATSATAAPSPASTSAKRSPSPLDAPVTSATRPLRSNSCAAALIACAFSPTIKPVRQPSRKPRREPEHDQGSELDQHERNDPDVDVPGGDLRRRDAAQEEQRRPERRMHVGGLQVDRHPDGEPE